MELIRESLSEQIYTQLRQDIVLQKLPCGRKLTLRELQDTFEVSSTPVREALTRLAQEGLVELIANQGARVVELGLRDMLDIQDMMSLLDCHAVQTAMQSPDREALSEALAVTLSMQKAALAGDDPAAYWTHNNDFHEVFYAFADNRRLIQMAKQLGGLFSIVILRSGSEHPDASIEEHAAILEAVCTGDAAAAVRQMENHFDMGKKRLEAQYRE